MRGRSSSGWSRFFSSSSLFRVGWFLPLALSLVLGCTDRAVEPAGGDRYSYAAYDGTGALVAEGWLAVTFVDSVTVTGSWQIAAADDARNIGPQLGSGRLVGGVGSDGAASMWLELQPDMADNNVQLRGVAQDGRFSGEWTWTSWSGIAARGSFEARRAR